MSDRLLLVMLWAVASIIAIGVHLMFGLDVLMIGASMAATLMGTVMVAYGVLRHDREMVFLGVVVGLLGLGVMSGPHGL